MLRFVLFIPCLFLAFSLNSEKISLSTGKIISRSVDLDEFDYVYSLQKVYFGGKFIQLKDGSVWKVSAATRETKSFYNQKPDWVKIKYKEPLKNPEKITQLWNVGDSLIFHKLANHPSILVYNSSRQDLVNFIPFLPPEVPLHTFDSFENGEIILNDGSRWYGYSGGAKKWEKGDPIMIAKDCPLISSFTHIFMNMKRECIQSEKRANFPCRLGTKHLGEKS